jgi:hypothetical protein
VPVTDAHRLTRRLMAPPGPLVDEAARHQIRDRLVGTLAPMVERLPRGGQVEVNLPLLRRALTGADRLDRAEESFSWRPAFVRRSLGLAVVSACARGRFRTPAEAVGPVADEAVMEWDRTGWRTFHWEPWLAGLAPGARAVVLGDALTWATVLWSWFDWGAFASPPRIGGVDDQWICPANRTLRLKGRAELRVPLGPAGSGVRPDEGSMPTAALVSVSGGCPGDGWADELAYLALVAGLRSPTRPVPSRVVGLWPDAGFHTGVEIDRRALEGAVDRVVATVAVVVDARSSSVLAT